MLTMAEADARAQQMIEEVRDVRRDVEWVYRDLVSKHYPDAAEGEPYGFGYTCHAYMMLCFARIDSISAYWAGGKNWISPGIHGRDQTKRMVAFLDHYYPRHTRAHRLAVVLWRHTLMHEGIPRPVVAKSSGEQYHYRLDWFSDDAQRHYTLIREAATSGAVQPSCIFYVDVVPLFADLEHMVSQYASDLRSPTGDPLRKNYAAREKERLRAVDL